MIRRIVLVLLALLLVACGEAKPNAEAQRILDDAHLGSITFLPEPLVWESGKMLYSGTTIRPQEPVAELDEDGIADFRRLANVSLTLQDGVPVEFYLANPDDFSPPQLFRIIRVALPDVTLTEAWVREAQTARSGTLESGLGTLTYGADTFGSGTLTVTYKNP